MDISRGVLDNLMGRDRNLPKDSIHARDHYSNSDVCKPFLICFCFNTLFPNTVYDEGPCNKRHDTYLKTMFENDVGRGEHERGYIKECIGWIERRLQEAEQKTKKNQNTIESKSSLSTERPRQILDRILSIDKDIEEMMRKAAIFGENGQIDDSSRCLEEVDRLRERRKEIDLMGDNLLAVVKQQKICEICGAIQTINDTEKRIQMHLEGKIHQGFLRLRTEIETLKIRLEIINQRLDKGKEKEKEIEKQKQKQKEKVSVTVPSVPHHEPAPQSKPKQSEKIVQQKEKERERERQDSHSKKRKKQHKHKDDYESRDRRRERSPQRREDKGDYERFQRSRSKDRHRKDKDSKKDKKRRSQQKQHKRQRSRQRQRDRRNF